jgi:NAD(P)H-flavin reductase
LFGKNITIIGGGCGAAPLKGMLDYITKNRKDFGEVNVFFGFRTPEDILFKEDIRNWKKIFSVGVSVDKNPNKSRITCDVCFVTKTVERAKLTPENNIALFCGPPVMINALIDILKNKGFQNEQIYLSTERLMHCALGVCGHCMIHGKYTCIDGPVFRYDELCD